MAEAKRRNYIVNRKFQLRWTILIALVGSLIAAVFSALLWLTLDEQDALLSESMTADEQLRGATEDISILLLNMPETTKDEAADLRSRFETQAKSFTGSADLKKTMLERNARARRFVVVLVALIFASLFVWGIFVTHRVAGPLYVIKTQLASWRTTRTIDSRRLRKGDEFQDVYDELTLALGSGAGGAGSKQA